MIYNYKDSGGESFIGLQKEDFYYYFTHWGYSGSQWAYANGHLHEIDDTSKYNILGPTTLVGWGE